MAIWVYFQCYESVTMQLCLLGVTTAINNYRNSSMYISKPGVGIRLYVPSQNRTKLPQNIEQLVICHLLNAWSWKRAPWPYVCSRYIKKSPYILHMLHKIFHFVWKFSSAWKFISHCKLFKVIWFCIVLCQHMKVVKGPSLPHIFSLFCKTYDMLQSLRLHGGSSAFKQKSAKAKCESLKEGLRDISGKKGPGDYSLIRLP